MTNIAERTFTRVITTLNVRIYRASRGRVWKSMMGRPLLLLTVAGRKSGRLRTKPVVYFINNGDYVVSGSLGGAPAEPLWFRNLRAAKTATVEIGGDRFDVDITIADEEDRHALWGQATQLAEFYGNYQARTERLIPMARLTPRISRL
ncbi:MULTISPECIES: nitroreductase/quinone reductase family protein [Frankia]|uniref:nitroreductase/quinone reductase family protein n=1 Tax=Frankia TaxID=1854 RepID=UPI000461B29D|nr:MULTISPECIES: nitroreductase/quinone reductase family protein [Frankia]KDA42829.1 hypothetical protein BMG523Draft_02379 [Frankia sp. BMG5.23]ORT93269.1 hypothetical protein UK99_19950 [Frankia casuarinae]ORT93285.1 hypothetical protein UK99_19910 [Frankia casuarinae]